MVGLSGNSQSAQDPLVQQVYVYYFYDTQLSPCPDFSYSSSESRIRFALGTPERDEAEDCCPVLARAEEVYSPILLSKTACCASHRELCVCERLKKQNSRTCIESASLYTTDVSSLKVLALLNSSLKSSMYSSRLSYFQEFIFFLI